MCITTFESYVKATHSKANTITCGVVIMFESYVKAAYSKSKKLCN